MTLRILQLPEDVLDWPAWLEAEIAGPDLVDLIAELEHVSPVKVPVGFNSLEELLADRYEPVLELGLAQATPEQIQTLVNHPRLLVALRDAVLLHESDYWERLFVRAYEKAMQTPPDEAPVRLAARKATFSRRTAVVISSLAAAVLFGASVWFTLRPAPTEDWGLLADSTYASETREQHFQTLANAVDEFLEVETRKSEDLRVRLTQLSRGCERCIEEKHPHLTDLDWQWLISRCERWKLQVDDLAQRLALGEGTAEEIKNESRELVESMSESLRQRALEIG